MHHILVAGAGKMGSTIAKFLADSNDYNVFVVDNEVKNSRLKANKIKNLQLQEIDINDQEQVIHYIHNNQIKTIICALPYFLTETVAHIAKRADTHFFDLTEDTHAASIIKELARKNKKVFASQCGLAPGFINIVARDIIDKFSKIDELKLRCGALPKNTNDPLKYSLSWSTDGLINEYANPCYVLANHEIAISSPLEELEEIQIDGLSYEAFNTSGGIGSLIETYQTQVNNMTYKSIRYPGHCDKMRFLMKALKLNQDRTTLKRILETAIPITKQDVVIVYVSATGYQNDALVNESYVRKFYPKNIAGMHCTAIQAATASAACAVVDLVVNNPKKYQGHIKQEDFHLSDIENNRFGKYFAE